VEPFAAREAVWQQATAVKKANRAEKGGTNKTPSVDKGGANEIGG